MSREKKKQTAKRYGKRVLAKDYMVSNDTRATGLNCNDLIVGGSGSGKTGSILIPSLQCIETSVVISDTKGKLYDRFKDELNQKGYKVNLLDFINPSKSTCGYNPISCIRKNLDGSINEQDIVSLANTIINPVADHKEPIWSQGASSILQFLISYLIETKPYEKQNMIELCDLYDEFIRPDNDKRFLPWIYEHPHSFAARKFNQFKANKVAEKMWASYLGFVNEALAPFMYSEAKIMYGRSPMENIDMKELGNRKSALFINVSDTDKVSNIMINMFYMQAFAVLCQEADMNADGRLKVPCRIFIDDFAASAQIEDFCNYISVIRSRDIFVSIILQSMSQLEGMYGAAGARTIANNCDHLVYMSGMDEPTVALIANRACVTTEKILNMDRKMCYVLANGCKAQLCEKIIPYSTCADYQPYVPEDIDYLSAV